jgi:asparagine synthase (glutamine-hydrolysing)
MLRGIQKLPAAHTLTYQDGQVTVTRYWDLPFLPKLDLQEPELVRALESRLRESVASHLVSDVAVGALLSGGMDSSMVVALLAEQATSFRTFSVGVDEQDFDELPYARAVADQYGTCHTEERVAPGLIQLLPQMIWHLDEPSDPIAACQFHAAELAARQVKVVLGGDGGDELFAGFDRYLGVNYVDYYAAIPGPVRRAVLGPLLSRVPDTFAYKSLIQKLRWMHQLAGVPDAGRRYAEATCFFRFSHEQKQVLYGDALRREVGGLDSARVIAQQYDRAEAVDPLDRMLYADYVTRLPEHSLMLVDRMTMAHGLEARSPYLDHELVEFMAAVPASFKIRGRQLKYILRQLAAGYLPPEIVRRSKQGFMFPIAYWFRDTLYDLVRHLLLGSHWVREGLFREVAIGQLLEEHRSGKVDHHVRLWMLLNLVFWHQILIEEQKVGAVTERVQQALTASSVIGARA